MKKIFFEFGDDEWHHHKSESIWAEQISKNKFRIRNSPFFARGVSFEDIIEATSDGEKLIYKRKLISAGHSTYRLLVKDSMLPNPFDRYWKPIENLGCSYEENSEMALRMFSVDVPPNTDVTKVYKHLEVGKIEGIWDFDEGHCGHIEIENGVKRAIP